MPNAHRLDNFVEMFGYGFCRFSLSEFPRAWIGVPSDPGSCRSARCRMGEALVGANHQGLGEALGVIPYYGNRRKVTLATGPPDVCAQ
jgi:hypothetical protein